MTDLTEVDGIIGRFISASDEARNRFIDELLAEIERLERHIKDLRELREYDRKALDNCRIEKEKLHALKRNPA